MDVAKVIRSRRAAIGLTQAQLAEAAGIDKRQIRRYEAGETYPTLPVAMAIARVLDVSLDELAGGAVVHRVDLSGDWHACWQSQREGIEDIRVQPVRLRQRAELVQVDSLNRGRTLEQYALPLRDALRSRPSRVAAA